MYDFSKKDKFYEDSVDKQLTIMVSKDGETITTVTNADLYSEDFTLDEGICSAENLEFRAESTQLKFRVRYDIPSLIGCKLEVSTTIDGETLPIGTFYVDEDKPNGSRNYRDIVAYDLLYTIINKDYGEWYKRLVAEGFFPCTVSAFADAFLQEVGLVCDKPITVNADFEFPNNIYKEGYKLELSGGEILTVLAEASASFPHINRFGHIEFIQLKSDDSLYPAEVLYPSNNLLPRVDSAKQRFNNRYYISCTHEDFKTKKIDKVQIIKEDGDIGVFSGNDGNTFTIIGNWILSGYAESQTACDNILNAIKDIEYTPCNIEVIGNPCMECGDLISFISHEKTYNTYILHRTLKGIQALKDTYEADGTEEIYETDNSLRNRVLQLTGKSNVLRTDLDKTISELADLDASTTSRFEQTAESISTTVSKVENVEGAVETLEGAVETLGDNLSTFEQSTTSRFEQTAESINAKVSQEGGNTSQTFRWELKSDHASYYCGNGEDEVEVFRSDENGINVTGITINNGKINVVTTEEKNDIIKLRYNNGVAYMESIMAAGGLTLTASLEGLSLYTNISAGYIVSNQEISTHIVRSDNVKTSRLEVSGPGYSSLGTASCSSLSVDNRIASWQSGYFLKNSPTLNAVTVGSTTIWGFTGYNMPTFEFQYFLGRA